MVAFLVPLGLQAAARAAPFAARFAKPALKFGYEGLKKGLGYFRPYQMSPAVRASGSQVIQSGKFAGQKFKDVYPNLFKQGNMPRFNITSTSKSNIALQTPFYAGAAMQGYDALTDNAEQSAEQKPVISTSPQDKNIPPAKADDKKDKDDKTTSTDDQIKKGGLDSFINDRIGLFEKYIGDDTRKRTKSAGYNAMIQFGLELATKRGNLVEGIAESAKEPLKEFAKLGNDLMDRAAAIKKAGIESGVEAFESAQERKLEEKKIAGDIAEAQIRSQAQKLSPGEFITGQIQSIIADPNLVASITASNYDEDNKKINPNISDESLIQAYAANQYEYYNAKEIPDTAEGKELYESLPSGTMVYFKGQIFPKP